MKASSKTCAECGTQFTTSKSALKFCSEECRTSRQRRAKATAKRKRYGGEVERQCVVCGTTFLTTPRSRRLTCSAQCVQARTQLAEQARGVCQICSAPLPPGKRSLCGSEACKAERNRRYVKAWYRRERGTPLTRTIACAICATEFTTGRLNVKYCSRACGEEATRRAMLTDAYREAQRERYRKRLADPVRREQQRERWRRNNQRREPKSTVTKECAICGAAFQTTNARRTTCSSSCSAERKRRGTRKSRVVERACAVCGKSFPTLEFKQAYTCSPECRARREHEYRRSYWKRRRDADRVFREQTCVVCKTTFRTTHATQTTCSPECRRVSRRLAARAYYYVRRERTA